MDFRLETTRLRRCLLKPIVMVLGTGFDFPELPRCRMERLTFLLKCYESLEYLVFLLVTKHRFSGFCGAWWQALTDYGYQVQGRFQDRSRKRSVGQLMHEVLDLSQALLATLVIRMVALSASPILEASLCTVATLCLVNGALAHLAQTKPR
jgi:hypothetical protein